MPAGRPPGYAKTGGRKKGSVNFVLKSVEEICAKLNVNPLEAMIHIANDESSPIRLRFEAFKEVSQYLYSKKRSIEVSGSLNPYAEKPLEELRSIAKEKLAESE